MCGVDINNLRPENQDKPFNERSSAAKITAVSGGFTEGLWRTLHKVITGRESKLMEIPNLRGLEGRKEYKYFFPSLQTEPENKDRFQVSGVGGQEVNSKDDHDFKPEARNPVHELPLTVNSQL
jgi:hypothetical protein